MRHNARYKQQQQKSDCKPTAKLFLHLAPNGLCTTNKKVLNEITRFSPFWYVRQRGLVDTDVSGEPIGPIFKGQAEADCSTAEGGTDRQLPDAGN
jgi:hypothetical protein